MEYDLVTRDGMGRIQRYPATILFTNREGVMVSVMANGETIRRRLNHDYQGWFRDGNGYRASRAPDFWLEERR